MEQVYIVVEDYENSNADPIQLNAGDTVKLGEKSNDDGPWANWIYCVSERTEKAGWTPVQILQMNGATGTATTDYTAEEMTVAVGDILYATTELNGWLWCLREADNQRGWVPKNCLCHAEKR